jgi:hypothetical protein
MNLPHNIYMYLASSLIGRLCWNYSSVPKDVIKYTRLVSKRIKNFKCFAE